MRHSHHSLATDRRDFDMLRVCRHAHRSQIKCLLVIIESSCELSLIRPSRSIGHVNTGQEGYTSFINTSVSSFLVHLLVIFQAQ